MLRIEHEIAFLWHDHRGNAQHAWATTGQPMPADGSGCIDIFQLAHPLVCVGPDILDADVASNNPSIRSLGSVSGLRWPVTGNPDRS